MTIYFNLIGLLLGISGTIIIIKGALNTSAAHIRQSWKDIEKSWEKEKPHVMRKLTCYIAKKFGSKDPRDTQDYTVEVFEKNFWGFILLFLGFLFQLIGILIQLGLMCDLFSK